MGLANLQLLVTAKEVGNFTARPISILLAQMYAIVVDMGYLTVSFPWLSNFELRDSFQLYINTTNLISVIVKILNTVSVTKFFE